MASSRQAKQAVREHVWARLEDAAVVQPGVRGHIPDFAGAGRAAARLAGLGLWMGARVVKAVPDRAQYPVRVQALQAGKLLYVAVPRLAGVRPFYRLDPGEVTVAPEEAADIESIARFAATVGVTAMRPVDLVVCGSVAVNKSGVRIGKGAGYSDIEMALLAEAGLLGERTAIVTTVHDLQVLDDELAEELHDFHVDLIVTPEQVIWCESPKRPAALDWNSVTQEQVAAMPVLRQAISSRDGR